MVHLMIEILWFTFLAGLAVAIGLLVREVAKGLLDQLFENPTEITKVCKTCYGVGYDSSGQKCQCKEKS